ncbi:protein IQ-DOMAIN 14-like [Portunus trituberculatus]|uniref:protein IQ-DOMAIN 14-like n=1 Tax=Portunus trituberculatus TaxID=210409 RepID=UPI001E1CD16D|nr:protein IQ-DOMAIN 14-like [Portunus trituberculatus]
MPCCRTSYSPPLSHRRLATAPFTLSSSYLPAHLPSSALSPPTYNPATAQPQPSHPPTHTALPPPDPPGAGLCGRAERRVFLSVPACSCPLRLSCSGPPPASLLADTVQDSKVQVTQRFRAGEEGNQSRRKGEGVLTSECHGGGQSHLTSEGTRGGHLAGPPLAPPITAHTLPPHHPSLPSLASLSPHHPLLLLPRLPAPSLLPSLPPILCQTPQITSLTPPSPFLVKPLPTPCLLLLSLPPSLPSVTAPCLQFLVTACTARRTTPPRALCAAPRPDPPQIKHYPASRRRQKPTKAPQGHTGGSYRCSDVACMKNCSQICIV